MRIASINYYFIKHSKSIDFSKNNINCKNSIISTRNLKTIKKFVDSLKCENLIFSSRIKFIEFFICNIKIKTKLKIFKFLLYIISKIDSRSTSNSIETKIVKIFKIINKLINEYYDKTHKINIRFFAIAIATLIV